MASTKINQVMRVHEYMKDKGSITQDEAQEFLGVWRLASRISDLKKSGVAVTKEMERGINRYGEPVRYARYRLEEM